MGQHQRQKKKLHSYVVYVSFIFIYTFIQGYVMGACTYNKYSSLLKYVAIWVSLVGGSFDISGARFYMLKPEKMD